METDTRTGQDRPIDDAAPLAEVEGRVAFVTGGSSGIGLGICRALLDAGMSVAFSYLTPANLVTAMDTLADAADRVHPIRVDVTDRPGMEAAAEEAEARFGRIHLLVNNAGVGASPGFSTSTYDDWDWVVGVNLTGVFNGIHAFLPRIRAHGDGGHVVATASMLGLLVADGGGAAAYTTTKAGVITMMENLRAELQGTGVSASVYIPGVVTSQVFESARSRPASLAHTADPADRLSDESLEAVRRLYAQGMDQWEAGRLVLRGIRSNDLYILTHPEFERGIRDRMEALLVSSYRDVDVPAERLAIAGGLAHNPMYTRERDRRIASASEIGGR